MNETNEANDWTPPAPPQPPPSTAVQDIPSLLTSTATPPPPIIPTKVAQKVVPTTATMIKDESVKRRFF